MTIDSADEIAIRNRMVLFISDEIAELTFISPINADQRAFIHFLARSLNLMAKSRGYGQNREVIVYKPLFSRLIGRDARLHLTLELDRLMTRLLMQCPINMREKMDVIPYRKRNLSSAPDSIQRSRCPSRLSTGVAVVPGSQATECGSAIGLLRRRLPIFKLRNDITDGINNHPVIAICGETGSEMTTQVPQYIMERAEEEGRLCHVVCALPSQISAIAMAERVAFERNYKIGQEVGYHIGFESVCNARTVLTFTTYSILLRTLMSGDVTALAATTHLILDELQLRDCAADLLLAWLRASLPRLSPQFRLVLMAAGKEEALSRYFGNCPILAVPSCLYQVGQYYLVDILKRTGFMTSDMLKFKNESQRKKEKEDREWVNEYNSEKNQTLNDPDTTLSKEKSMNYHLEEATKGSRQSLEAVVHLIRNYNISVNHRHPNSRLTPLMVASIHGHADLTDHLLDLNANMHLKVNRRTAYDLAKEFQRQDIVDLLTAHQSLNCVTSSVLKLGSDVDERDYDEEEQLLMEAYRQSFKEDEVNYELILAIIDDIQAFNQKGAILIFLPGFEEIMTLNEILLARKPKPSECELVFMILHAKIDINEQKKVIALAPKNVRRVILTSSASDSYMPMEDLAFVIDCGLLKECSSAGVCEGVRMRTLRCSQTCAWERAARVAQCPTGICYRLYSRRDCSAMDARRRPEILRMPLQTVCLQSKMLTRAQGEESQVAIADWLSRTLDAPSLADARACVQLLKTRDVLDPCEVVTLLGMHLVDISLPPYLGKALLYGVLLKCLDPVLTIVAMLAFQDPFVYPLSKLACRELQNARRRLASGVGGRGGGESDHCLLLQVYMRWLAARNKGPVQGRDFCRQHHLCEPRLELVYAHRMQLLQQLRSAGFVRNRDSSDLRDLNSNSERFSVVKAALTAGHFPNLARVDREFNLIKTPVSANVQLHPWSVLQQRNLPAALPCDWLIYEELHQSGPGVASAREMRVCTLVTDLTVAIFAGPQRFDCANFIDPNAEDYGSDSEQEQEEGGEEGRPVTLMLDEWVAFQMEPHVARQVVMLRDKLQALLARRLRMPAKPLSPNDDMLIQTVAQMLSVKEMEAGLTQPLGIGNKPPFILNAPVLHQQPNNDRNPQRQPQRLDEWQLDAMSSANAGNATGTSASASSGSSPSSSSSSGSGGVASDGEQASGSGRGFKKYFILKYKDEKYFEFASKQNVWFFHVDTEISVKTAFREGKTVILLMSRQGSGEFQGYAKLISDVYNRGDLQPRACPPPHFGMPLPIEWIKIGNIDVTSCRHVLRIDDYNQLQRQACYRGPVASPGDQEMNAYVGEMLCQMWENFPPPNPQPVHLEVGHGRPIRAAPQPCLGAQASFCGPKSWF